MDLNEWNLIYADVSIETWEAEFLPLFKKHKVDVYRFEKE